MERISLQTTPLAVALTAAVSALQAGKLVIYPTETTYGIGADATVPAAVQNLLQYKRQRQDKPFSVLVADQAMAAAYAELNATALSVWERFLPGPVTVVVPGKHTLAPAVESVTGTLALRHSSHAVAQALVAQLGHPLTATSANPSHQKRPYAVDDVLSVLSERQRELIGVVLDAGTLPPNEPSTIIDTTNEQPSILREGSIPLQDRKVWTLNSVDETIALGKKLVARMKNSVGLRPVVFALNGPMGVGKTHLTKGIAQGLGIEELVKSPSYTLMHEYAFTAEGAPHHLFHLDAWRLESPEELAGLGLETALAQNDVIVLEWAGAHREFFANWQQRFHARIVWVSLQFGDTETARSITLGEQESA